MATWLAAGAFFGGVAGSFCAGFLADKLGRHSLRWYFLTPALALLIGLPVTITMLLTTDPRIALALFLVQQFTFFCYSGPIYAVLQFLVPASTRAMVVAVHLFILNLVGLGFGPLLIGMMNDSFNASLGAGGAIRLSLLVITIGTVVSVICFWLASRAGAVRSDQAAYLASNS